MEDKLDLLIINAKDGSCGGFGRAGLSNGFYVLEGRGEQASRQEAPCLEHTGAGPHNTTRRADAYHQVANLCK